MFENKEGQRVPNVTFRARRDDEWVDINSRDLFEGRNVVVFALPGAFTPTCSSSHVPRYDELAPALRAQGIDEIVCISVNDAFVMEEWREAQRAENVSFVPDGNGEFSAGMGMLVDKADLGFGKRSWRYSMLVRDGMVEKMFIEPDQPGDPFEVSDADTMLTYLNADAKAPASVTVFGRKGCPFCAQAKETLKQRGMEFEELVLNRDFGASTLRAVAGSSLVPQVFIDGEHIGGAEELDAWLAADRAA